MLTYEQLDKLIQYDETTGNLIWKSRNIEWFSGDSRAMKIWNTRYSEKFAITAQHGTGYMAGSILNKKVFAHRIAAALAFKTNKIPFVDHINGIRSDNRKVNLRIVDDRSENMRNTQIPKDNTSGRIGVSYVKHCNRWHAYITKNGKRLNIGWFKTFDDACEARADKEVELGFHVNHGRAGSLKGGK